MKQITKYDPILCGFVILVVLLVGAGGMIVDTVIRDYRDSQFTVTPGRLRRAAPKNSGQWIMIWRGESQIVPAPLPLRAELPGKHRTVTCSECGRVRPERGTKMTHKGCGGAWR